MIASLSALPLEDGYHDTPYETVWYPVETEVVVAAHGGAINWLMIFTALLVLTTRLITVRHRLADD